MRLRLIALFAVSIGIASAQQLNVTGNIAASQITSGTISYSLFPVGTGSNQLAAGNDSRFLNATSLNGTSITTLTGLLKLTSGTPSNAAASDIVALWTGCNAGSPLMRYDGTCSSAGGTGSVTSVALTAPSFFTVGGTPITSAGTLALTYATGLAANKVLGTDGSGNAGLISITGTMLPAPSASSLGGIQSYAAVSHQWINAISTSGVPSSTQPSFADLSGSASVGQMPTAVPVWTKYTIPYTGVQTASTTNAVNIVALTTKQMVCGLVEKHTTAFAGASISGLTVTIGDSNGTSTTYAPNPFNLLQTVSNTAFMANNVVGMASFAGGNVQVNFTATGANLAALTAGSLDVDVCIVTLP